MFPFLGVVPPNPADEVTTPNEIVLMEQMLALESTGVSDLSGGVLGGGGGGSSVTLVETLWTDDSLTYYVRADNGTAITWFTPTGVATTAPGTGIRPAGGASLILDTSRYQAIAAGTGFIIGDYLSHVVTADPATGVVIAFFWLNVTQNTKLAVSPSSASIAPIAPLPTGAALDGTDNTGFSQFNTGTGIRGWLSGIYYYVVASQTAAGGLGDATYVSGNGTLVSLLKGIFGKVAGTLAIGAAANTFVDGADVTQGTKADAAATNSTGAWSVVSLLKGLYVAMTAATPAGSSIIGKVGIDQTMPGTTNGVQVTGTLPAFATTPTFNLGTSALALESGGNLAAILAKIIAAPATSANQNATAAGTSASNAQAVQGVTGGVAVPVTLAPSSIKAVATLAMATVSTTPIYPVKSIMGGITMLANALPTSFAGLLESITLRVKASAQLGGFYVLIFSASPTNGTYTDGALPTYNASDEALLVGCYHLQTPMSPLGTHTIYNLDSINKLIVGASTSLYALVIPDAATVAFASTTDVSLETGVIGN